MDKVKSLVKKSIYEEDGSTAKYRSVINTPVVRFMDAITNLQDQGFIDSIKGIGTEKQAGSAVIQFIDWFNKNAPAPELTKSVMQKYISDARSDNFDFDTAAKDFEDSIKNGETANIKRDPNVDIEKVSKLDIKKDTEGEELKVAAESKIMKKEKIKESIKSYILENYSKKKIEEQEDDLEGTLDLSDNVAAARKALFETPDEKIIQAFRNILSLEEAAQLYVSLLDFINDKAPAPDLDPDIAIKYLSGAEDRDEKEQEPEVDIEVDAEEETVDEMSTTAGAPAPATKYAFKRKKK